MIQSLIDKQDTFEIVGLQIAAILATEQANQQVLAVTAGKDPNDWVLRIFHEASNPFEQWLNADENTDTSPLINVWFDNSNFDKKSSNSTSRQTSDTTFNIDCYSYATSKETISGHDPGDVAAALEVQRAIRLVRNILMAAEYTYLSLRGTVGSRWPQTITAFQPSVGDTPVQKVHGARLTLGVSFLEFSPQYEGETLELISTTVERAEDGELYFEADYEF